jgi:hypothetical protein
MTKTSSRVKEPVKKVNNLVIDLLPRIVGSAGFNDFGKSVTSKREALCYKRERFLNSITKRTQKKDSGAMPLS